MWKYDLYSPICDIIFNVILVPLTAIKSVSWCMMETSLDLRRKCQTIVGNLSEILGNCREMFWNVLLSSGLRPKRRHVCLLFNKKKITWSIGDAKFIFSCWKHQKRNFLSPRGFRKSILWKYTYLTMRFSSVRCLHSVKLVVLGLRWI